jgi:Raf kinase inhibitor-like YbhB/YbcL family protein
LLKEEAIMKLSSPVFENGSKIPSKYTCNGEDINPPLNISGVPSSAKSLVLIMEDPDVPKNLRPDGMWDHWIVFNIPPDTGEILEGRDPRGVNGKGTGGNLGYMGPCPPDREHRYFFKLFALDKTLDLPEGAKKVEVEKAMKGHVLEKTELIGLYEQS